MCTLIIADDLTGALDVAGPFAARGVDTWVVVDADKDWVSHTREATVVSVNADTRHLSAQVAADRVVGILRCVDTRDRVLIKKIDSTLRGQVVAETLAMMRGARRPLAVVAPAFPAQGRTVRNGVVHVYGVPLSLTAFARDALSPPPLEPLHKVFSKSGIASRCAVPKLFGEIDLENEQVLVADAQNETDLADTVAHWGAGAHAVLWVGAAGIAQALAASLYTNRSAPDQAPRHCRRTLVVVGSRAEQSALQVSHIAAAPDVVVIPAPNGVADEVRLRNSTAAVVVLRAVPGLEGEGDAEQVAMSLASTASRAMSDFDAVVATGGDTARAILAAAHCDALRVMGDLMPGIPYGRMLSGAHAWWLVTKAGGFGSTETLAEIVARLRA